MYLLVSYSWFISPPTHNCKVIFSVYESASVFCFFICIILFSSVQLLSHVWLFVTPWSARLPCPSPTPGACSNSCPLSQGCHPTISSPVIPFCSLQSFPASGSFPMSQFFASGGQTIGTSASASVLPMNIQDWFPLGWISLFGSPCSPRDSQESSPAPQFRSVNSSALSLLYSPTLISIHDYWKNHSFNYMDLCWQSNISAF